MVVLKPLNLMLLFSLLLCACNETAPVLQQGAIPREATVVLPTAKVKEPTPVSTSVLANVTPTATSTATPIPNESIGTVMDVLDGNTVSVVMRGDSFGQAYTVRYIGIDAQARALTEPWGMVAFEKNRDLTHLKVVRLVRGETEFDEAGNLLRYVYLGDTLVNLFLAEQGLVQVNSAEISTTLRARFEAAETKARADRIGLWGPDPTPTATRQLPAPRTREPRPTINIPTSTPEITGTVTVTAPTTIETGPIE